MDLPRLSHEIYRLLASLIGGALLGAFFDQIVLGMLVASLALLGWHLRQLHKLVKWVRAAKKSDPPLMSGGWEQLGSALYRMRQDNLQRKARLSSMLKRFQASTSAMSDATIILDEQESIQWMNKATNRLLGLRRKKDVGQRVTNLVRVPEFVQFMQTSNSGEVLVMSSPVDKEVTLDIQIVPYGDNLRLMTVRDITRLRKLESMRRDFVANVSHELKTPLTVLSGYLESLLEHQSAEQKPAMQRALSNMHQQTRRMDRLIADLLFLSRLEHDDAVQSKESLSINMQVMLNEVVNNARELATARQQKIECQTQAGLHLRGSARELEAAFSNLLLNAVKYSPNNSTIEVSWKLNDRLAEFCVSDHGRGIAEQHIERLTERFYRVPGQRGEVEPGTGLGLSIVKHVLRRHDALLKITSEPGQGSSFCCRFKRFQLDNVQAKPLLQEDDRGSEALS